MTSIKNYYETLGVERAADGDTIKKAYRQLAVEWHPDKHQDAPEEKQKEVEEKFKQISEAYAVLSDPEKKSNYDLTGEPFGRGGPFGFRTTGDPRDILRHFGRNFGFPSEPSHPPVARGQSLQLRLDVSLAMSLFGGEKAVEYSVTSPCGECGAKGGVAFENCPICKGSGTYVRQEPNMIFQTACKECRGSGQKVTEQCKNCNGFGAVQENKKINVRVSPGLRHTAVLRSPGAGGAGFNGGPPGDVLLEVHVRYPDLSEFSEEEKHQLKELLTK